MPDGPLVSCLCPTRDRVPLLRRAVACFLAQTYHPRELVVLYQHDDQATRDYLAGLNDPAIRAVEVPGSPRPSTGTLRNIGIEAARGHYVAMWDDDDWHGATRLAEQVDALHESKRPGCILLHVTLYDGNTGSAYISSVRTWEGTLLAVRAELPRYPDLQQGSDTPVIRQLGAERKLVGLKRPDLYVYVYHGRNTWGRAHWETNLLPFARALPSEDSGRIRDLLAAGA